MDRKVGNLGPRFVPVILAGGGHRELWPLSRANAPVQFLRDASGRSPFTRWLGTVRNLPNAAPAIIVTSAQAHDMTHEQAQLRSDERMIVAAADRGPLPALALAVMDLNEADTVLAIDAAQPVPGEDVVQQISNTLISAGRHVDGILVGVLPVTAGAELRRGERDESGAIRAAGRTLNGKEAGYCLSPFVVGCASSIRRELEMNEPAVMRNVAASVAGGSQHGQVIFPAATPWTSLEARSDGALECASWPASRLRPVALETDGSGRAMLTANRVRGDALVHASRACDVRAHDHLTVLCGVENLRVWTTPDATLVAAPGHEGAIAEIADRLMFDERPEAFAHLVETAEWGSVHPIAEAPAGVRLDLLRLREGAVLEPDELAAGGVMTLLAGLATVAGEAVRHGETIDGGPLSAIEPTVLLRTVFTASQGSREARPSQGEQQPQTEALVELLERGTEQEAPCEDAA